MFPAKDSTIIDNIYLQLQSKIGSILPNKQLQEHFLKGKM